MATRDGRRNTVGLGPDGISDSAAEQLAAAEMRKEQEETKRAFDEAFKQFDADGNGEIDQSELTQVLMALEPDVWTKENVGKLWGHVDINADGIIDFQEFTTWLTKPKRPRRFSKDHKFTEEELMAISVNFQGIGDAIKQGVLSSQGVVDDDELEKFFCSETKYHCYGKLMHEEDAQKWTDERPKEVSDCSGLPPSESDDAKALEIPRWPFGPAPVVSCQKGMKGRGDPTPNQDNFSITCFPNGYSLACCFDGHGEDGHQVSTRCVQTVPFFLVQSQHWPDNIEAALKEAFVNSHKECVHHAVENDYDAEGSGSTAVAALWKDSTVWFANAGDSRGIIVRPRIKPPLVAETIDHKPEMDSEKIRIEEMGGEVRSRTYPDGFVNHRVFFKGENYPGLCMTRTLGDEGAKACGVTAEPEVTCHEVDMAGQPFLLISSDGVWEFVESRTAARVMAKEVTKRGAARAVEKLQSLSRYQWETNEECYCDDITTVLVFLQPSTT